MLTSERQIKSNTLHQPLSKMMHLAISGIQDKPAKRTIATDMGSIGGSKVT
jgi:hypothetical protein